jgi:hypothetical protein
MGARLGAADDLGLEVVVERPVVAEAGEAVERGEPVQLGLQRLRSECPDLR